MMRYLVPTLLLFLLPAVVAAQVIEEEDIVAEELAEPELEAGDASELESLFRAAREIPDPELARESYDRLLEHFEALRQTGELDPEERALLVRVLEASAGVHLALGNADEADAELVRRLELDPAGGLAEDAPKDLVKRFDSLRSERVGELVVTAEPPDLSLRIDGRPVELERPPPYDPTAETAPPPGTVVSLLAGTRLLQAERAGWAPFVTEVEVRAGRRTSYDVALERVSAVVRLNTQPRGAEVLVDGISYGQTEGQAAADFLPEGARYRSEDFSDELVVDDVAPGFRVLEVRFPGYRPYRVELSIEEMIDYVMPPIVLEREAARLVLVNLPDDAEVRIDGQRRRPENPGSPRPVFDLEPGEHEVQVEAGRSRMFVTQVRLADRQTAEVNVRLRPGLAFLGVLGSETGGARRDLEQALRLTLAESPRWSLLDRRTRGGAALREAGFTVETARRAARGDESAVDWTRVQSAVDALSPGLVYLVAVLADDLLAAEADVFVWAAAPGPARADHLRVELGRQAEVEALREQFHKTVELRRPWLGAVLASSEAAAHPVIVDLVPDGPLAATGVRPGDRVVGLSRVAVFTGADVERRVLLTESGETIDVGVEVAGSSGDTQNVKVTLGSSPLVYPHVVPGVLDAVLFTELELMAERARPEELWVLRLNQALALLRARDFPGAVKLLRGVEAPDVPYGVGKATVDYWLGMALAGSGPRYREAAIEALERAASVPGARLEHNDGPFLAPRAKARLLALGAAP